MSTTTPVYIANRPLSESLTYSPVIGEYMSNLRNKPNNRPGDRRINNKRLLLIYDRILTDDQVHNQLDQLKNDITILIARDYNKTYVAVDFNGTYNGDKNNFVINGISPLIKTILQSQWEPVANYFNDYNNRQIIPQLELSYIQPELPRPIIPQPELPYEQPTWYDDINELRNQPPQKLVHWYWESRGNRGKTKLANDIEYYHSDWLIINDLSEVYYLISDKIASSKLSGIILDLDRMYEEDPLTYRVITWILDGRMSKKGRVIKFNSVHLVVLSNWSPHLSALSEGIVEVTEITQSY